MTISVNETWRCVKGYEGLYLVSSTGVVKKTSGKVLKQCIRGHYKAVTLIKNKVETLKNVHRIVAESFLPNPLNLPQVNHKDEYKYNNCVENLEWCTSFYNINYGNRTNLALEKLRKPVCAVNDADEIVMTFKGVNETAKYGFTKQAVSECCRGLREHHKGYRWRFL